jgi:hypothetical protein
MSRRIRSRRFAVRATILSLAGAGFCLFVCYDLCWWWDGFFLILLGMVVGQFVGIAVLARVSHWRHSDAPAVIGGAVGISAMVSVWLYLPEEAVRVLGHVARLLTGCFLGLLFADITRPYRDRGQLLRSAPEYVGQGRPSAR